MVNLERSVAYICQVQLLHSNSIYHPSREWDHKEGWGLKNWYFPTVVLEKTLGGPLHSEEIKPVHPKGNQSWIFIGRTDAEVPILWPPDAKSRLIGKDPDDGKDWGQEEKGTAEDEMVGWCHWFNGHEFEQSPIDGEEQGSLACCSPWGHKESDTTEWLNNCPTAKDEPWLSHMTMVQGPMVSLASFICCESSLPSISLQIRMELKKMTNPVFTRSIMTPSGLLCCSGAFPISESTLLHATVVPKLFYCPDHHPTPDSPVSSDAQPPSLMKNFKVIGAQRGLNKTEKWNSPWKRRTVNKPRQDSPSYTLSIQYLVSLAQKGHCFPLGVTESKRNNTESCRYQKDIKILADILVAQG